VRATLLILLLLASGLAHAVEIIAHRGVPEQALTLAGARAMFGMRLTQWSDGQAVRVFVLPDRHPTHVAFVKTRLDLYPYQLRQNWDRLVFSGMAQAPIEVADEREMLRRVAATPGAIGYVRKAGSHDQVKSLAIQ
jgi:ABC-type phosphate transport system substrate-binding protein